MQIADKRRREAQEKAARSAEDTEEEQKVLNYLSTQAANLRTRTMNPQHGATFANGLVTNGMGATSTIVPGARPNFVNLSNLEQNSLGHGGSSRGSSVGHRRGDSFGGGFSGPLAPASPYETVHSNSLSSLGAGDTRTPDKHMAALRTTLGVDFIDDGPLRGPVLGDQGTRIRDPTQVPLGAGNGPAGAAALPDLLREVQEEQMRLKAQFAQQLEGYGREGSHNMHGDPNGAEKWSAEERRAAADQLAHVEVLSGPFLLGCHFVVVLVGLVNQYIRSLKCL